MCHLGVAIFLQLEQGGVFGEDENRFVFSNVLVGTRAKARFKISNDNKVSLSSFGMIDKLVKICLCYPNPKCVVKINSHFTRKTMYLSIHSSFVNP